MIITLPAYNDVDGVLYETTIDLELQINGGVGFLVISGEFRGIVYGEIVEIDESQDRVKIKVDTGDLGYLERSAIRAYMNPSEFALWCGQKIMQDSVDAYFDDKHDGQITGD